MDTPMLLELQFAKTIEYLLAVGFLLLFIPFWHYVSPLAARRAMVAAQKPVESEAAWAPATLEPALAFAGRAGVAEPTGWFSVPDGIRIHPGHAWVKSIDRGEVVAGVDDFTRAVVGPIDDVDMHLQPLLAGGTDTFQRLPETGYTLPNTSLFASPVLLGMEGDFVNFYREQGYHVESRQCRAESFHGCDRSGPYGGNYPASQVPGGLLHARGSIE